MPKSSKLLTVKEVNAIKKTGLTAVGGVTGLCLYIDPKSNGKSYVLRYTNTNGKRCHISVGPFASMGLKEAREIADEMRKRLAQGIDPIEDRRRKAAEAEQIRLDIEAFKREERRTVARKNASFAFFTEEALCSSSSPQIVSNLPIHHSTLFRDSRL